MGTPSVYLPTEAAWQNAAPEWAWSYWRIIHVQLEAWCARYAIPLHVDTTACVFTEER